MTAVKVSDRGLEECGVKVVHLERVAQARRETPDQREREAMAAIFKALGDPTRLMIISALRGGEMCVCDLQALLGISQSGVSHQIRRLRDLRLIKARREGQMIYYSLDDDHVAGLVQACQDHVDH